MDSETFYEFPNGDKMPAVGLGTWRAENEEQLEAALNTALEAGYRHIDTAPVYLNEKVIGRVLKNWIDSGKVQREELFIVTKLPPTGNRAASVEKYLRNSLEDLQLTYIDLYLIHCPFAFPDNEGGLKIDENGEPERENTDHIETWKEFERLQAEGLTKHIGVSNFNQNQLQRLVDNCEVKPESLQVELHLYLQQKELVNFCKNNNILVTSYSSMGSKGFDKISGREIPDLMQDPEVVEIAEKLSKTPAQILLKFLLQQGITVIPKSTNEGRIKSNFELFDFALNDEDMEILKGLDRNFRIVNFEFFPGIEKHPEYPFTKSN